MKIDKAVEKPKALDKGSGLEMKEYKDALKLGVEALKRIKESRVQRLADFTEPLRGETPE